MLYSGSFFSWLSPSLYHGRLAGLNIAPTFECWLVGLVQGEAFEAMEVDLVIKSGADDLDLDAQTVKRLLVAATARGGKFKAVDGLVTVR